MRAADEDDDSLGRSNAMRPPSPRRLGPYELADGLQPGASQYEHRRLAGLNDATVQEFRERGGGDGGGRLNIEADSAELEQRTFDLV